MGDGSEGKKEEGDEGGLVGDRTVYSCSACLPSLLFPPFEEGSSCLTYVRSNIGAGATTASDLAINSSSSPSEPSEASSLTTGRALVASRAPEFLLVNPGWRMPVKKEKTDVNTGATE